MCRPKFLTAALVAAVAALAGPSTSQAAYTITLKQAGFADMVITDQDFSLPNTVTHRADGNTTINMISGGDSFTFGTYTINAVSSSSNVPGGVMPGTGGQIGGFLTQNTFAITSISAGAGPLTIMVSADGFTVPGAGNAFVKNSISTTALDGTASVTTTVSPTTGGSFTTAAATLTGPTLEGSTSTSGLTVITSTPFTITNTLVISGLNSVGNTANITTTSTVTAPAPAGLILAATALPFAGLLRRRLRRAEATTAA